MMMLNKDKVLNVIVADDSSTIRLFIIKALKQSDYPLNITEAVDGKTCLELLSSGRFDLAFIDINMPRMSGIEAVNHSREMGVKTFITIMSSQSEPEKLDVARKLDAYAFLVKPFTADDVASIIRNYIQLTKLTSVLLVDDSRAIRAVIHRVLQNSLFHLDIEEAQDGADALIAYEQKRYEIVFLDMNMPGISGSQALVQLRQLNRDVQVVLITTIQNQNQVEALARDSYASVLYKPFYTADVDKVLHELHGLKLPELRYARQQQEEQDNTDVELL